MALVSLIASSSFAQSEAYDSLIQKANYYFSQKDYKNSTAEYTKAFIALGGKGVLEDRYKAAIAWTIVGVNDSAFFQLFRLANKTKYLNSYLLLTEPNFNSLHTDKRWDELQSIVNPTHEIYNDSLAKVLSKIFDDDQKCRTQMEYMEEKFGRESQEFKNHISDMINQDSVDLVIIQEILTKYGWLSVNEVGEKGNTVLWAVIQHAALPAQEKYYPIMEVAVSEGKASSQYLAYLKDRILMRQGKKQLYGTQYKLNKETGEMDLWDIEDPENLNKRRETVGLPPL